MGDYLAWCTPTAAANVMGYWQDVRGMPIGDGIPYVDEAKIPWNPPTGPVDWQDFCADATSIPARGSHRSFGQDLGYYLNTNDEGDIYLQNSTRDYDAHILTFSAILSF